MSAKIFSFVFCLVLSATVFAAPGGGQQHKPRNGHNAQSTQRGSSHGPSSNYRHSNRHNSYRGGYRPEPQHRHNWNPRPGYYSGWRYNPYWYPRWYYQGYVFPRWYWVPDVQVGYWQCTSFNEYGESFSAVGQTQDTAAYNSLYNCGGNNYQDSGCYIPQGYCQFR